MIQDEIKELTVQFDQCKNVLVALGDENRIHILSQMLQTASLNTKCRGMRVGEISKIASLSRPAISHHIRILKEAGIIQCRKEGTMNFYFLNPNDSKINEVIACLKKALQISAEEGENRG